MTTRRIAWPAHTPLIAVLLVAIAVIIFINPLREMPIKDDWAYVLTVRTLLETGQYHLHEWSAPNLPFQVIYGSLFARALGGLSFSSLRLSTLSLMLIGLISFYFVALEHRLSHWQAGLLALLLLASPLVLKFSFSFMTNIPFLGCALLALWLYTRGLRLKSYPLMFVGSLAAAAATLTRQFGMAFVAGLLLVWAVDRDRWRTLPLMLAGVILPAAAAGWQLYTGIVTPNWTAIQRQADQAQFMARSDLLPELLWRLAIILIYLALFSLPLLIPALAEYTDELRKSRGKPVMQRNRLNLILMVAPMLFILGMLVYGVFGMGKYSLMPFLASNFFVISDFWPRWLAASLTLLMVIYGVLLVRLFTFRYVPLSDTEKLQPRDMLLDFVTLGLLIQHLIFVVFVDEYVISLIPYVLIVVGRGLGLWLDRLRVPLAASTAIFLITSALWVRGYLEEQQAQWQAAEELVSEGVDPFDIIMSWEWSSSHGGFNDYLKEINYQQLSPERSSEYFDVWLPQRLANAHYLIGALTAPPDNPKFQVLKAVPYEDILLRTGFVYVLKRDVAP